MPKKRQYHPDLEQDLKAFLQELCDDWDFCAEIKVKDLLLNKYKTLTPKIFADTLIVAEGMNLKTAHHWQRRLKRRFVQRYGNEVNERIWKDWQ
jgi:predicted RNA-binding protein Jag